MKFTNEKKGNKKVRVIFLKNLISTNDYFAKFHCYKLHGNSLHFYVYIGIRIA